ncbi:MAG: restriction endonuclease subunit S [Flavobacteriaceae bacterium]
MEWEIAKLGDVCNILAGGTPKRSNPSFWNGDIPWVKISDMLQGNITETDEHITELGLKGSSAKILPQGTVLVSIFATIGRTATLSIPAATNQAIAGVIPKSKGVFNPGFLEYCLQNGAISLKRKARGVAQVNINSSLLKNLKIPIPPLEEQTRITRILDTADALRKQRTNSIEELDALLQSKSLDLFGDPLTNPKEWDEKQTLGDTCEIVSGITKGRKTGHQNLREIPYLAVSNVQDQNLNLDVVKTIEATETEISRYRIIKDDLLLTEGGDPDKLGRGTLWNNEIAECIHQNHIFRVRIMNDGIIPEYLIWLIGSRRGKSYFLKSAKQTTGIASINMTQLKRFPLLIPPLDIQHEFAKISHKVKEQKALIKEQMVELDSLFNSLQKTAFSGDL